ncbi:hypothetical protein [Aureispira anguillae]|uniref:Transmembrane protein n=1 Tax=Aureispira anguillae TaxID=2864201 RepID=A0A916DVL7_9BACT|nr:hypothetical protein [Aureispira anguillae]BDS13705.1 hypothetical protein AsAng_0044460 [Aureispira anguillae]
MSEELLDDDTINAIQYIDLPRLRSSKVEKIERLMLGNLFFIALCIVWINWEAPYLSWLQLLVDCLESMSFTVMVPFIYVLRWRAISFKVDQEIKKNDLENMKMTGLKFFFVLNALLLCLFGGILVLDGIKEIVVLEVGEIIIGGVILMMGIISFYYLDLTQKQWEMLKKHLDTGGQTMNV